jgi:hypothetical protein
MTATLYPVVSRLKQFESAFATPTDFGRGPGKAVPARQLLDEPGWAPYCLDAERREVVFVRLAATIDLSEVPFYFVTQYREAQQLAVVSFETALEIAAGLPDPQLVQVFSIGRCGSTLVSHALNGPANVVSLSEPGVFEHRPLRALAAAEDISGLIRDLFRLTFAARSRRGADTLAVKHKSQALFVSELLCNAVPASRNVFLYRDAVSWGNSFMQFLASMNVPMPTDLAGRDFHWMMVSADKPVSELARFIDIERPPVDIGAILAPGWTIHLEEYERLRRAGLAFHTLRYNELVADRVGELTRLFDYCNLRHDGIARALSAFDEDSQKGTQIARRADPVRMSADETATFRATLAKAPRFADPDLILADSVG